MTQVITFTQAQDSKKAVVADRYVAHALYTQNRAIVESLGGTIITGVGGFRAEFKKVADAKKFIEQAITGMSKKEYNATRKVRESKPEDEGNKKPKTSSKGNKKTAVEVVTLVDADGNEYKVPKSALQSQDTVKKPARKSKGNATPTKSATTTNKKSATNKKPASAGKGSVLNAPAQKALDEMKKSILNRAASAYSIAHGGEATTFDRLGKSEKVIKEFMPAAKVGLLKSAKWAKASKTYGLTEEMLG